MEICIASSTCSFCFRQMNGAACCSNSKQRYSGSYVKPNCLILRQVSCQGKVRPWVLGCVEFEDLKPKSAATGPMAAVAGNSKLFGRFGSTLGGMSVELIGQGLYFLPGVEWTLIYFIF